MKNTIEKQADVKNGVRIFEYTPGFCHAKMSVVDDLMATCGTINLEGASVKREENSGFYGKLSNAGDPDQKSEGNTGESSPSPEEDSAS